MTTDTVLYTVIFLLVPYIRSCPAVVCLLVHTSVLLYTIALLGTVLLTQNSTTGIII